MIDIVAFLLMWVFGAGAYYTFGRKMILNRRYWSSLRAGIRERDVEPILDAKKATEEEIWWTLGFVLCVLGWVIALITVIS